MEEVCTTKRKNEKNCMLEPDFSLWVPCEPLVIPCDKGSQGTHKGLTRENELLTRDWPLPVHVLKSDRPICCSDFMQVFAELSLRKPALQLLHTLLESYRIIDLGHLLFTSESKAGCMASLAYHRYCTTQISPVSFLDISGWHTIFAMWWCVTWRV